LLHHDTFWFVRTPFAQILLTLRILCGVEQRRILLKEPISLPPRHLRHPLLNAA
jgi:hypothetical protein